MLWRQVQMVLVPAAVIGGYFLAAEIGGALSDFWDDFLGPFLITYWIGLGFANMWDVVKDSVKGANPGTVAATTGAVLVVLVIMIGPASLLSDLWMFGIAIAPAFDLILPYFRQKYPHQEPGATNQEGTHRVPKG
jgi:hypothetical protein